VTDIRLYNTLTRSLERFEPLRPGFVGLYSCGPTVYSHQHLGNMRPYLFADLLKRVFRYFGYTVRHVVNITDVGHLTDDADLGEDKMEEAARRAGISAWDVAERWTAIFKEDIRKLDVIGPDVWCKATDHIAEQIEMVEKLEEKGFTYRTTDGIYFDTSKDPHYGELARLDVESQQVQERIDAAGEKRNPVDFALWKLSPADGPRRQMEWDSPWGRGFPGWHLECSAMSSKYLGVPFDIHTGGVDHIPVHHTNEIAQSENAFDVRPWVRYWLHEEWLMFEGAKVSKSKGGAVTLADLEETGIEPLAYRLFFLGAHYRQQQTFTEEAIGGAQNAYQRLVRHALELRAATDRRGDEAVLERFRARFRESIADDLNAPQALAVLWDVVRSTEIGGAERWDLVREFDGVLGLDLEEARLAEVEIDEQVEVLIREREEARRSKNFARADEIRDELIRQGIVLEDTSGGTRWRRG
jgi:cysteinyl-tRNA synthetase